MGYIIGMMGIALLGLLGIALYERSKRNSAEALNENLETKEKVNDLQKDVSKNEGLIEAEKQRQDELKRKLEEEKNKDVSKDDLLDFFNRDSK